MSSKVIFCSGFVCGAMVGAIGIWKYVENKYERIAQEEIDSVKNVYSKKGKPAGKPENQCDLASNIDKACQIIHENGYTASTEKEEMMKNKNLNTGEANDVPYVIAPEKFMEHDDYDTISLTYYSDNVLADEDNEIIEDVEGVVGEDSLNHFGEYEDDAVYVRNDARKVDYEILLDQRKYKRKFSEIYH
jgi:hypothetical protein